MLADVPDKLQTFFRPQVEQLGMREEGSAFGGYATLPAELGEGYLWVAGLGENCLVSVHDFTLRADVPLREYPVESYAMSLMSESMAHLAPVAASMPVNAPRVEENLVAFHQRDETTELVLPGRTRCRSTTLCFLPAYFEQVSALTGADPETMAAALARGGINGLPPQVARCLKMLTPVEGRRGSERAALGYAARALEALAHAVGDATEREAQGEEGSERERRLVDEALALMEARMGEKLVLSQVANELFVSRTALCDAFRSVVGKGAAACLADVRMERARELLVSTELPVSEIAARVGFAHQSSFCTAFKNRYRTSPTTLRRAGMTAGTTEA